MSSTSSHELFYYQYSTNILKSNRGARDYGSVSMEERNLKLKHKIPTRSPTDLWNARCEWVALTAPPHVATTYLSISVTSCNSSAVLQINHNYCQNTFISVPTSPPGANFVKLSPASRLCLRQSADCVYSSQLTLFTPVSCVDFNQLIVFTCRPTTIMLHV